MHNSLFNIAVSVDDGTISSIILKNDPYKMNWCSGIAGWGEISVYDDSPIISENGVQSVAGTKTLPLISLTEEVNISFSVYGNGDFRLTAERSFDENGFLNERYTVKNLRDADMFLEQGDIGIALPFNDIYTYADDCMVRHCNTHIWCGGNTSYISAVKMGESDFILALF